MAILIRFSKLAGAGNDFVLLDSDTQELPQDLQEFAHHVCRNHLGIGADGVIIIQTSSTTQLKIRVMNPDGSEASMCGNAIRCGAHYVFNRDNIEAVSIEMNGVEHTCLLRGSVISSTFAEPRTFKGPLYIEGREVYYLDTGTDHAVVFVPTIDDEEVIRQGVQLRHNAAFAPKGTNVNFVQVCDHESILVRTYERYLERETLSCGTGAVAAALISRHLGKTASNHIRVLNRTEEHLEVDFGGNALPFSDIRLTGPAKTIFTGEILW